MNLFILTKSDGSPIEDKTVAAVTSVTDSTAIEDLGNIVLYDSEPLVIKFTTGSAAPSFAGDATYSLAVSLGAVSSSGNREYASTTAFSVVTGGWSGRMALTPTDLIDAVHILGGQVYGSACGPLQGGWLTLQIRVTNPSGYAVTYALLRIFVIWPVVAGTPSATAGTEYVTLAAFLTGAVHPRTDITSLTGGGSAALDGQTTAASILPTGYTVLLSYGRVGQTWQLIAGTDAESPSAGVVRPDDYDASTNARIWVQL